MSGPVEINPTPASGPPLLAPARWPRRAARWAYVAAAVGVIAVSIAADTQPCTPQDPCAASWSFALAVPLLFLSVLLLWWRPATALVCGALYAFIALLWDPSGPGRIAAVGFAAISLTAVVLLLQARAADRAAVLARSRPLTVPPWVTHNAAQLGPVPWPVGRIGAAAACAAAAVLSLGLLLGSWTTYQDRLDRAETVTGEITASAPEDPFDVTITMPDGGQRQISTLDEYSVGDLVQVRLDPHDVGWVELVAEPWDQTWWLSLALGSAMLAVLVGVDAVRRRRGLTSLLSGEHPGVEICAAPIADGEWLGAAWVDDPSRRVWAGLRPAVTIDRILPPDEEAQAAWSWTRPTRGILYGDLRVGGQVGFLLDDAVLVDGTFAHPPRAVVDLADPRPGHPLPTSLQGPPLTAEEVDLYRAEALSGATHVAAVRPASLPVTYRSHPGLQALGVGELALGWLLLPLLWWFGDLPVLLLAGAATFGAFSVVEGLLRLRPTIVVRADGVQHATLLATRLLPWAGIRQAVTRDQRLVLDLHDTPHTDQVHPTDDDLDVLIFESARLAPGAAEQAASFCEALRHEDIPALDRLPAREQQRHDDGDPPGVDGPLVPWVLVMLCAHVMMSLLLLGMAAAGGVAWLP